MPTSETDDFIPAEYPRDGTLIRGSDGYLYFIPGDLEVFRVDGDDARVIENRVLDEMNESRPEGSGVIEDDLRASKTTVAVLRRVERRLPEGSEYEEGAGGEIRMAKTTFFNPST